MWRKHIACWMPKARNTHTGSVILIAFPLQHWMHEGALMSRLRTLPVSLSLKQNNNSIASEIQYQTQLAIN
jgi:hypothetical protein